MYRFVVKSYRAFEQAFYGDVYEHQGTPLSAHEPAGMGHSSGAHFDADRSAFHRGHIPDNQIERVRRVDRDTAVVALSGERAVGPKVAKMDVIMKNLCGEFEKLEDVVDR